MSPVTSIFDACDSGIKIPPSASLLIKSLLAVLPSGSLFSASESLSPSLSSVPFSSEDDSAYLMLERLQRVIQIILRAT
jgi:hypothetical protein